MVAPVVSYEILKITMLSYICMVGIKVDPSLYIHMVKLQILKLYNLWLMHPISSKLWGNAQDYGLDGYYRI